MPLTANEVALLGNPTPADIDGAHQVLEFSPSTTKKLGKWTVVFLILNRTIGSGIFLAPAKVLAGTGCVGGALFLWLLGGLVSVCGLYVWLECSMSMPQRTVRGETEPRGVPRSGGEKNFLEFMFPNPKYRTTCTFAVMFILLYNLTGNAISFGVEVMIASNVYDPTTQTTPSHSTAVGIAIGALTFVIGLHIFSRRGGILVNNAFAIVKVSLLLVIVCLGIAKAGGAFGGFEANARRNFTESVFTTHRRNPASWASSLVQCMYAFSGYEQPFYVLTETKSPRRTFPKYTVLAMIFAIALFLLVNIAFLLAVPKDSVMLYDSNTPDLGTLFFQSLFGDNPATRRAVAALIAISIFGNLVVMTFTASRVKQEIAKEGILPFSLTFATSYITPYGLYKRWKSRGAIPNEDLEHAPTAAFGLHWASSVLLLLVTLPINDPQKASNALIALYSYAIISLLGGWVSVGLILTKLRKERFHWSERRRYRPWLSPAHPIIYALACGFMLVAGFLPPDPNSPFSKKVTGVSWYIVPTIGLSAPLWGLAYYAGLRLYERRYKELVATRTAFWMEDPDFPGEYVQIAEIVDHYWQRKPKPGFSAEDGWEMKSGAVVGERNADDSESRSSQESRRGLSRVWTGRRGRGTGLRDERRLSGGFEE